MILYFDKNHQNMERKIYYFNIPTNKSCSLFTFSDRNIETKNPKVDN